jgi:DNA-binding transcriptional regulator YiaG
MPDVASVLKAEISRLARREIRKATNPLKSQVRDLREKVARQKKQITVLEKDLSQWAKKETAEATISPQEVEEQLKPARISSSSVKRCRRRLKLSQRQMGQLLGVSMMTVARWEQGKVSPRGRNKVAFLELRGMGIRQVKKRLEEMEG